jgi:tight adherence protein B
MELVQILVVGLVVGVGVLIAFRSGGVVPSLRAVVNDQSVKRRRAEDQRALVEAIATWTENLRDTISASSGLEQAIIATEHHSPRALAPAVQRLVASLRYGSLEDGLRRFADDVAHPTCDFVVAALITSSQHQTRDVGQLLGHLSDCARAECHLYLRIWVSRARSRTAVRIITGAVATFVVGLVALNPVYLAPFFSTEGALVFVCVAVCFVLALVWMQNIARIRTPARFLTGRLESVQS